MLFQAAHAKGEIFTIEIRLDVSEDLEDLDGVFEGGFFIAVTPAIHVGEQFFEVILADVEWVKPYVATPHTSLFNGSTGDHIGWPLGELKNYMQEAADKMLNVLERIETGTYFTNPDIY